MRILDPDAIYEKALSHPNGAAELDELELMLYAIKEIENHIAMSGWTAFFVGSCAYLCDDLRRGLERCADTRSLVIIDNFAKRVVSDGYQFPDEVEEWSRETDGDEREWGRQFRDAKGERWERVASHLRCVGCELSTETSVVAPKTERFASELAALLKK